MVIVRRDRTTMGSNSGFMSIVPNVVFKGRKIYVELIIVKFV